MAELTENARQAIEAEIFAGNKIQAIKLFREAVPGAGLAEAKQAIDQLDQRLRIQHPDKFPAHPRKAGCLGVLAGLLLLLAAITVILSLPGK